MRFWGNSSAEHRQGSDQSNLPASMAFAGDKVDTESQYPVTREVTQQTQMFSIMDKPV